MRTGSCAIGFASGIDVAVAGVERGPDDSIADVPEFGVGHATLTDPGWLTGTTVILPPAGGAVAGVDVRGGAPGTRETDVLRPGNLVDRADAIVLTGGSALGLAAVDGVMRGLLDAGRGWPMGAPGEVVPIVPAAGLFDLGRGGVFAHAPGAATGATALAEALSGAAPRWGSVGAGTGARAGGLAGGVGSASAVLPGGGVVAALVVVNAVGSPLDPTTGALLSGRFGLAGGYAALPRPGASVLAAHLADRAAQFAALGLSEEGDGRGIPHPGSATTIGVVATDLTLTAAQCGRLATVAHDGIARAVDPAHTLLDGDTLFALASGSAAVPDLAGLWALHEAAATCVARAIGHALLGARSTVMWPGTPDELLVRSYRDFCGAG